jgi:hypothetical protein
MKLRGTESLLRHEYNVTQEADYRQLVSVPDSNTSIRVAIQLVVLSEHSATPWGGEDD